MTTAAQRKKQSDPCKIAQPLDLSECAYTKSTPSVGKCHCVLQYFTTARKHHRRKPANLDTVHGVHEAVFHYACHSPSQQVLPQVVRGQALVFRLPHLLVLSQTRSPPLLLALSRSRTPSARRHLGVRIGEMLVLVRARVRQDPCVLQGCEDPVDLQRNGGGRHCAELESLADLSGRQLESKAKAAACTRTRGS